MNANFDLDNDQDDPMAPVVFKLLNGNLVKVVAQEIRSPFTPRNSFEDELPEKTYRLIVFSNDYTFENAPINQFQVEPGIDFTEETIVEMLATIREHIGSDSRHDYEELDEFNEWLVEASLRIAECPEDAVRHYEKLPNLTYPEAFDRIDDSFFNDQND